VSTSYHHRVKVDQCTSYFVSDIVTFVDDSVCFASQTVLRQRQLQCLTRKLGDQSASASE